MYWRLETALDERKNVPYYKRSVFGVWGSLQPGSVPVRLHETVLDRPQQKGQIV